MRTADLGDTRIRPFCGFIRVSPKSAVLDNAVILELANAFSRVRYKPLVISLIEAIQQSPKWHYLTIDETLMAQGLSLFKQRLDKDWSLTDCLGIHLARRFQVTEIFTTDHHFEQAGFRILLKSVW